MANTKRFQVKHGLRTKDIEFTDNSGAANEIVASFIDATDTLSFSGNSGQLFAITDSITGSIFTVNDISGMPSIEVMDTGDIYLAETSGNVGIGTSSPDNTLMVQGASTNGAASTGNVALFEGPSGTNGLKLFIDDAENAAGLQTIGTDDLLLNPHGGSVGIGTASPNAILHIASSSAQLRIEDTSGTGTSQINFADNADGNIGILSYDHSDNSMQFRVNDSERMRLDSAGRLGIGTNIPAAKTVIATTADNDGLNIESYNTTQSEGPALRLAKSLNSTVGTQTAITVSDTLGQIIFAGSDGSAFYDGAAIKGVAAQSFTGTNGGTELSFHTTDNNTQVIERKMILSSSGVLTLGTGHSSGSPGTAVFTAPYGSGTDVPGGNLQIFGGRSTGDAAGGEIQFWTSPAGTAGTNINAALQRMTITTDGDVGIGTNTPQAALSIFRETNTGGTAGGTTLLELINDVGVDINQEKTFIDFIFLDDNANEYPQVRIGAEVGPNINANGQELEGEGAFVVYTNDATGNGPGSPTGLVERMRVDYQGKVGIGTQSPTTQVTISNNLNPSSVFTASISGTTMSVTTVTSGALAVGDRVIASGVLANTKIVSQSSGTAGSTGDYVIDQSQTRAQTTMRTQSTSDNVLRFTDSDTTATAGNQIGTIEFYSNDDGGPGVQAFITAKGNGDPTSSLVFGTSPDASTQATERMIITDQGDVGINVAAPQVKLHVQHDLSEYTESLVDTTTKATLHLKTHAADSTITSFGGVVGGHAYIQRSNGAGNTTYGILLNPYGGKVGIGTTAPVARLHVNNDAVLFEPVSAAVTGGDNSILVSGVDSNINLLSYDDDSTVATNLVMGRYHHTNGNLIDRWGIVTNYDTGNQGSNTSNALTFNYGTSSTEIYDTANQLVAITPAGDVGIGISNPSYKLHVDGDINAQYSGTNANVIGMHNGASGEGWIRPFSSGGDFEFNVKYTGGNSDYIFYVNDTTELMRIQEGGNVGIGTSSPTNKFEVAGTQGQLFSVADSFTGTIFSVNDGSGVPSIEVMDTGDIYLAEFGGNVGIGTSSPGAALEIYRSANDADIILARNDVSQTLRIDQNSIRTITNSHLGLGTNNNTHVYIDTNGHVGIGTTAPTYFLTVNESGAADGTQNEIARFANITTGATSNYIYIGASSGVDWKIGKNVPGTAGRTNFDIADNADSVKLTIQSGGEVGIGTNAPEQKLHIIDESNPGATTGSVIIEGRRDGAANVLELRARDASASTTALPSSQGPVMRFTGFDGTDFEEMAYIYAESEAAVADGDAPSSLVFGTTNDGAGSATRKMTIKSNGNVAIGTGSSPAYKLDVAGYATATGFIAKNVATQTSGVSEFIARANNDNNTWMVGVSPSAGSQGSVNNLNWGLFWAGDGTTSGPTGSNPPAYGTSGTHANNAGPGNIWGNAGNQNEFVFVGANVSQWICHGSTGDTWQRGDLWVNGTYYRGGQEFLAIQDAAPTGVDGNLWWESDTGKLKIYYNDGNTSQWVDAVPIPDTSTLYSKAGGTITGAVNINSSLTTTGSAFIGGDVYANYSDNRLKNFTGTIESSLDKVKSLNGYLFTENEVAKQHGFDNDAQQVGVSAQEVQAVLPEAVALAPFDRDAETGTSKSGEDYLTVQYEKLVPLLIEAIKEQSATIEALTKRLEKLEG